MLLTKASKYKVQFRCGKSTKEQTIEADDYSEVYEQALLTANRLTNETGKTWIINL